MKQANFDVSHELDEFLMVEKPLTHSKRKANPDLEKMKPELRQLEEQYVTTYHHSLLTYDFILLAGLPYITLATCSGCHIILTTSLWLDCVRSLMRMSGRSPTQGLVLLYLRQQSLNAHKLALPCWRVPIPTTFLRYPTFRMVMSPHEHECFCMCHLHL